MSRTAQRAVLCLGVGLLGLAVAVVLARREESERTAASAPEANAPMANAPGSDPAAHSRFASAPSLPKDAAGPSPEAPKTDPLVDLDVEPHPLGKQRERDAAQHELFDRVTRALERRKFDAASALLAEHDRTFGADGWHEYRRGYELVLACLTTGGAPGEPLVERAEEYIERERLSPVRRQVRRVCLEGRGFRRTRGGA